MRSHGRAGTHGLGRVVALLLLAGLVVLSLWACAPMAAGSPAPAGASTPPAATVPAVDPLSGLPTVSVSDLPAQGRAVLAAISAGGPFAYSQDGAVFGNREAILPKRASGYYHEYTVPTPGSPDRGARRLVAGGGGEVYYTDDHYASFRRVWP